MASVTKSTKKRGATKKIDSRTKVSGWLWLATGLLVGLFIAFLVFLHGQPQQQNVVKKPAIEKKTQQQSQDSKTLDYDFYKILPKLEVVTTPDETNDTATKKDESSVSSKIKRPGIYVVQAGSFQRYGDADKRKANLALLGIASKIVAVKMDDGKTWHRVQIGPFDDLRQLNETRDILAKNKIDTLLLKVKG